MLKHTQQGLITSQHEGRDVRRTESKGGVTKQSEYCVKPERRRGEEKERKMKLDRREAGSLRDRSNLQANTLSLICMGLPPDVVFKERLSHEVPNGPEDLLSALHAECPSMIPRPLSQPHPSTVT